MEIKGQAALVTGGASGLGAGTARKLAAAGARVALLDVNAELGNKLAAEIGAVFVQCDVSSGPGAEAAVAKARSAHGPARILVNCAGIGGAKRLVGKDGPMPLEHFTRIVNVNLVGSFNMMRLAAADMIPLPALADGERGVMINTSSIAAYDGQIGQVAYSASKGGIVSMTLPLARDLAQFGVRVMTIAPGIFHTPLLGKLPEEVRQSLAASIPFPKRLGTPEEYAQLALHIVENVQLNGEVIRLDGALRMAPR
ncbi:MAG TPA: SDR family NAD(P)-dependent oxidoreductase [Burkholderiales bacterium]|nr:SDR family NAD(P)-dependent oxidoreductase [Burkholderiales bacterium]